MNDEQDDTPLDLSGLYADRMPPPDLEERVTADYADFSAERRAARAVSPVGEWWAARAVRGAGPMLQVAAALLLFLGGFALARVLPGDGPGTSESPVAGGGIEQRRFMLLLWQGPDFHPDAQPGQLRAEYTAWARATASAGIAITGAELADERDLIAPAPAADTAPAHDFHVGGYFVVAVADAPAARRLAEGHPHIGHGGWIEVAEVR